MDVIVWLLVVVIVAAVAWAFGASRMRLRYRDVLEGLAEAAKWGDRLPTRGADLPGVDALRGALAKVLPSSAEDEAGEGDAAAPRTGAAAGSPGGTAGKAPSISSTAGRSGEEGAFVHRALERMRGYLEEGVEEPLRSNMEQGGASLHQGAEDALVALEDLYFYLRDVPGAREVEDLNELAREAGEEYHREWGVDVDVHVPERPTRVEVNREALLDALYLVLHNAGTFAEGVDVETVVRYQDGECWLVVRDRGEGFGDEALAHAFDPFYGTTKLGLGLGLYHVKKVVEAMGGTVAVRNRRRGGGQVEIVLPEAAGEE